jgi:hypothetical protein
MLGTAAGFGVALALGACAAAAGTTGATFADAVLDTSSLALADAAFAGTAFAIDAFEGTIFGIFLSVTVTAVDCAAAAALTALVFGDETS